MRRAVAGRAAFLALLGAGCVGSHAERPYRPLTGGSAVRGEQVTRNAGCAACHVIPGIRPQHGYIGPSLAGLRRRAVIAGRLPNDSHNLTHWIMDPQGIDPETAMPNLGLTEPDARDAAAFLYTLDGS